MRWYSILIGYLIVIIEGQFPEKVINMSLTRGIFLWDITQIADKKIMLKVRLHGYRPLAKIARKCMCRTKIIDKKGLPFQISRMKKRKILALGSIFFLLSIYILTSFVWIVEVQGAEDLSPTEIKELAAKFGLEPGVVKAKLNIDELEEKLQEGHPKLAWVGISIQGTKVTIEISEKVLIPETEDHQQAHLIAKENGVIEEMLVLVGTPQVKEGDNVQKGQILISGLVYPELHLNDDGTYTPGGTPELVRARGIVRAKVKYSMKASCPLKERELIYTGKKSEQLLLVLGNNIFVLKGPKAPPFTKYEKKSISKTLPSWRNINMPVEIITNIFFEQKQKINDYSYEGAYKQAVKRGEKSLQKIIPSAGKILNKETSVTPTNIKGIVEVEVIWEVLENIAIPEPISKGDAGSS